jgi:hypothetical protein
MPNYKIKCVAVGVRTDSGVCPGSAKCHKDETYVLTAEPRKPQASVDEHSPPCTPMAFAMRWSEEMVSEKTIMLM